MISVVVPIYNRKDKIEQAVNCILAQTIQDFELILVDDGSTDGSTEICGQLAEKDKRIKVIYQKNGGVSMARNAGLAYATGEWLVFMDSDDAVKPDMYEKMLASAQKNQTDLVVCGISNILFDANDKKVREEVITEADSVLANKDACVQKVLSLLRSSLIHSPVNKLYKMSIIRGHDISFLPNISLGEDLIFNLEYLKSVQSIAFLEEPLYLYRASQTDGLVSAYRADKHQIMTTLYQHVLDYIGAQDVQTQLPLYKKEAEFLYIKWTYSCFIDLFKPECPFSYKEKKAYIGHILAVTGVQNAAKSHIRSNGFSGKLARAIYGNKITIVAHYSRFMYLMKFRFGSLYNRLLTKFRSHKQTG
ncbi:glycosyltransferase family 2 protein [Scatolibacter rhodanostii]|uniref:glycosyltransferase family 2 protein n=1 Tax=Scatolibacter rhodanostii TaxID=2014781 RepID=UPI00135634B2|nr:glycosyltransferase [Scatolibacter rhodanostii]